MVGVSTIINAPNLISLMEEHKRPSAQSHLQLTLDRSLRHEEVEGSYDHLVAHLVEDEQDIRDTNEWTRVFTRDGARGRLVGIYRLGPDLLYDKSVRDSLSELQVSSGEVLFSPLEFKKDDLMGELSESRLPMPELLSLGRVATVAKARFARLDAGRAVSEPAVVEQEAEAVVAEA